MANNRRRLRHKLIMEMWFRFNRLISLRPGSFAQTVIVIKIFKHIEKVKQGYDADDGLLEIMRGE